MISKWNYLPLTSEESKIEAQLATRFPNCAPIARLLVQRGIKTREQVREFFYPSLSQLHDPFLMRDMDKAVARLNDALGAKEKIMVYGDYDVDGTTAVALVYRYLLNFYSNVEYYVPTRDDEGYGISIKSVDYAHSIGVKVLFFADKVNKFLSDSKKKSPSLHRGIPNSVAMMGSAVTLMYYFMRCLAASTKNI